MSTTEEKIRQRAYVLYQERLEQNARADWLEAEEELQGELQGEAVEEDPEEGGDSNGE